MPTQRQSATWAPLPPLPLLRHGDSSASCKMEISAASRFCASSTIHPGRWGRYHDRTSPRSNKKVIAIVQPVDRTHVTRLSHTVPVSHPVAIPLMTSYPPTPNVT